ncbi:MAG: hypothetical protein ACOC6C_01265, partial [Verrucomicrobiota bacterium]
NALHVLWSSAGRFEEVEVKDKARDLITEWLSQRGYAISTKAKTGISVVAFSPKAPKLYGQPFFKLVYSLYEENVWDKDKPLPVEVKDVLNKIVAEVEQKKTCSPKDLVPHDPPKEWQGWGMLPEKAREIIWEE